MNLSQLAHAAQRALEGKTTHRIKRGHVYELLAAACGHGSWAALTSVALLSDGGVGEPVAPRRAELIARALELGHQQEAAEAVANALTQFVLSAGLRTMTWARLAPLLAPPAPASHDIGCEEEEDDEWLEDGDESEPSRVLSDAAEAVASFPYIGASPLLLDGLKRAAEGGQGRAHHALARHFRCRVPSSYLYEESLKGRALTIQEQRWVDEYLAAVPRFAQYRQHLRAAAELGVRQAALEYAKAFQDPTFAALAEKPSGPVDAYGMATVASTPETTTRWLQTAAAQGSSLALRELADSGDEGALRSLAINGDLDAIRTLAERAMEAGEPTETWTWLYVSQMHGVDLTRSSLAACHDGGEQDGEFYDSDFGGPLYVAGAEAFAGPALSEDGHRAAKAAARAIFEPAVAAQARNGG
jgi:hypothetical protein